MISTRLPDGATHAQAIALCRQTIERRREALENLRRLAVQLEAAAILDCRADHAHPGLAAVLRERAGERRRMAAVIRAHLDSTDAARQVSRTALPRVVRAVPARRAL